MTSHRTAYGRRRCRATASFVSKSPSAVVAETASASWRVALAAEVARQSVSEATAERAVDEEIGGRVKRDDDVTVVGQVAPVGTQHSAPIRYTFLQEKTNVSDAAL